MGGDEDRYSTIRDIMREAFADYEKVAFERQKSLEEKIDTIREQQIRSEDDRKRINEKLYSLGVLETNHNRTAQKLSDLITQLKNEKEKEDDEQINVKFFNKNPGIFFGMITFMVFSSLVATFIGYFSITDRIKKTDETAKNRQSQGEYENYLDQPTDGTKDAVYQKEINSMNKKEKKGSNP